VCLLRAEVWPWYAVRRATYPDDDAPAYQVLEPSLRHAEGHQVSAGEVATNGEQFKTFLTDEIARWKDVIDTGKIAAE